MDRLEAMGLLLRVVERGSLTAAARSLHMPLPTVSRKLAELEAHLGARLLLRTTRRLALTEAGEAYLSSARRILEEVEAAERQAAGAFGAPRGALVLTAPVLFGRLHVLPVVADFLEAYPEIAIRLALSDRNLHLVDDHVDLALRIGPLPDSSLVATRLGAIGQVVCASPGFWDAHGLPDRPAALAGLPCVTFDFVTEGGLPAPLWRFGERVAVALRPRLSVSTAEAAVAAAERGLGVTRLLRYQCAGALARGSLVRVLEAFEPAPRPVSLLHAPRATLPLKLRFFLDYAIPRLRAGISAISPAEAPPPAPSTAAP
ncbi:LysR substrate-binding domain-containing protein [Roseomonas sp. 18066]|uniref:LysR substrate-binding domain-containing protein n=1 Tax=Roseomonas sp. 18066 TaxID=2681412 RepID=UPI001356E966|nr:LysR substrate-binding domain-containing protein [Roseomonas sp. 18066]